MLTVLRFHFMLIVAPVEPVEVAAAEVVAEVVVLSEVERPAHELGSLPIAI